MFNHRIAMCVFGTVLAAGCEPVEIPNWEIDNSSDQGGGDGFVLELPFAYGVQKICTQGVNGSHSHFIDSTRYDLDIDTDNNSQEEIYAPVSGIARVHMESASSAFGFSINFDHGNGTYTCVGHLSDIFVEDGEEVVVGQLVGYEGNTGDSTGDHVHIGLHSGDASLSAEHGVSIPTRYRVSNASDQSGPTVFASEDFECGLVSQGDPRDGDTYMSLLTTVLWHPDGTLVKTPDNARVYVIVDGRASWIVSEDAFWGLGYSFGEVALISDEELACLGQGEDTTESSTIEEYAGLREGDLVKETDASDVYVIMDGRAIPIVNWDVYLMMGFFNRTIIMVEPGFVESAFHMGDCSVDIWCLDRDAITTCGGGLELSGEGVGGEQGDDDTTPDDDDTSVGDDDMGDDDDIVVDDDDVSDDDDVGDDDDTIPDDDDDTGPVDNDGDGYTDTIDCDDTDSEVSPGASELNDGVDNDCDGQIDEGLIADDDDVSDDDDVGDDDDAIPDDDDATPISTSGECNGQDACLADMDANSEPETLLMADDLWLASMIDGMPAFVWGYGGCYNGGLTASDLTYSNSDGYYEIDFSNFAFDCDALITLVSSVGTDGSQPASNMSNWFWWQGASFCYTGSPLCDLQDNGTPWEEWLISVHWDPTVGLVATGNGYTNNDQLIMGG